MLNLVMEVFYSIANKFKLFTNRGFSLIEISVVMLIIGILISGISQGMDLYSDFRIGTARKLTIDSPVNRIDNLALWLETTLEKSFQTKMVNNSLVSQWNNISLFDLDNKNAYSFASNPKPVYLENNINGLPAIQFKKTSTNCMSVESDFDNNSENVTIFIVLISKSINNFGRIIDKWSDTSKSYPYALRHNFNFLIYSGPSTGLNPRAQINSVKINFPYLVSARRVKSGKLSIWANGVKGSEGLDDIPSSTVNNSPLYIGCQGATTSGTYGDFNVGEIIIYSRDLNDSEISKVSQYLSQKWNIKI